MPCVDETIDIGIESYKWPHVVKFMLSKFWQLTSQLRARNFDLAIIFMPNIIRRLLLAGLGAKYWIYGNKVNAYPGDIAINLLTNIGIYNTTVEQVYSIPTPKNPHKTLPSHLSHPIICLHPYCGMQWRRWNKFDELRKKLTKLKYTVITVGQSQNHQVNDEYDLVNQLTLSELFWIIKQSDVFVTADSGPMHIAFAMNTPTVALFGPVPPELRVPQNIKHKHRIIYKRPVKVKGRYKVTQRKELDNKNMQTISVDEILAGVRKLLAEKDHQ